MDVGQWKAPRSLIQRSKLPSNSKVIAASGDPATIKSPIGGPQSNKVTGKPMSPASLSAPTSKAKTSIDVKMREKPPLRQKPSAVTTRIRSPSLEIISQPGAEIYPNSENVPLRFKIILSMCCGCAFVSEDLTTRKSRRGFPSPKNTQVESTGK